MEPFGTNRILIRPFEEKDIAFIHTLYTDRETMRYISSGRFDWTQEEILAKYSEYSVHYPEGHGIWVVEDRASGSVIGEAALFNSFDDPAILELGYILNRNEWGKGYGTEIVQALVHHCFETLRIKKVIARMYAANTGSVKLSEKAGMILTDSGIAPNGEKYLVYGKSS